VVNESCWTLKPAAVKAPATELEQLQRDSAVQCMRIAKRQADVNDLKKLRTKSAAQRQCNRDSHGTTHIGGARSTQRR
jgi:hypothetical protein